MKLPNYRDPADNSFEDCHEQSESQTPSKTEDSSQSAPKIGFKYTPHNVWLRVDIEMDSPIFHIGIPKKTGRNTIKEFARFHSYKIDKTENSCILIHFQFQEKNHYFVRTGAERDRIMDEIKADLTEKLKKYMERFPEAKLNWDSAKIVRSEEKVKSPLLNLSKDLIMHDSTFKKVYHHKDEVEITNPISGKIGMSNLTIKEFSPEIAASIEELRRQLTKGTIEPIQATSNAVLMMTQLLKEQNKPKQSILSRIYFFFRRRKHDS